MVELVEAVGLAQSTVSKHLACLRDCGLVGPKPVGRASLFRLTQPALIDVLTSAETVLQATGQAVALCPDLRRGGLRRGANTMTAGLPAGDPDGLVGDAWVSPCRFGSSRPTSPPNPSAICSANTAPKPP